MHLPVTIEANVEKAYTDVEQGTEQLQKASTNSAMEIFNRPHFCFPDTIEANVEKAYTDVEQGTEQLQKASTYQVCILN